MPSRFNPEPEPNPGSSGNKSNAIGGWLASLTLPFAMTPFSVALALIALLVLSGRALATNDFESAVLRFPEIAAWKFRPDVAAECANSLIQAGRDSAFEQLKEL